MPSDKSRHPEPAADDPTGDRGIAEDDAGAGAIQACPLCHGAGAISGRRCPVCTPIATSAPAATKPEPFSWQELDACPDCGGNCGGMFTCVGCGMDRGWCAGADDNMPEHCDDCWVTDEPATTHPPACWGCECGVPLYDGRHEEATGCDTDTAYTYPCTAPVATHSPAAWALALAAAPLLRKAGS